MTRLAALTLILLAALARTARGQWSIGPVVGTEMFTGVSRSTVAGPDRGFRPWHPAWWGIETETPGNRWRGRLSLLHAAPDLALDAPDLTVVDHDGITTVLGLRPGAVLRIARPSASVAARLEGGVILERWSFTGMGSRFCAGGELGLSLEVGLGGRLRGVLGGYLGVSESPFRAGELPEGYEPRSAWRHGLRGSLAIRL